MLRLILVELVVQVIEDGCQTGYLGKVANGGDVGLLLQVVEEGVTDVVA
jgi:hypothetical protein